MKRKFHPAILGGFVLAAMALIVLLIIGFGGKRLFVRKIPFVVVFPHSVNGLYVGSPVKFKGVPVGEVRRLGILFDQEGNPMDIIAYAELNVEPFGESGEGKGVLTEASLRKAIEKGLRARCASDSLVTGQLYVDLDIYTNAPPPVYRAKNTRFIEIPVLHGGTADFLRSLDRVNIGRLADQAEQILQRLNQMLAELDLNRVSSSLINTLDSINHLVSDPELKNSIGSFRALMDRTGRLLEHADERLPEVSTHLIQTLEQTRQALEQVDRTLRQVQYLLQPGTPLMSQVQEGLIEFTESVRALRVLLEELQEDPAALIRGKSRRTP